MDFEAVARDTLKAITGLGKLVCGEIRFPKTCKSQETGTFSFTKEKLITFNVHPEGIGTASLFSERRATRRERTEMGSQKYRQRRLTSRWSSVMQKPS